MYVVQQYIEIGFSWASCFSLFFTFCFCFAQTLSARDWQHYEKTCEKAKSNEKKNHLNAKLFIKLTSNSLTSSYWCVMWLLVKYMIKTSNATQFDKTDIQYDFGFTYELWSANIHSCLRWMQKSRNFPEKIEDVELANGSECKRYNIQHKPI